MQVFSCDLQGICLSGPLAVGRCQLTWCCVLPAPLPPAGHGPHRDLLTSHLISEVSLRYPDRIKFHFNSALEALDLEDRTAAFRDESQGTSTTVPYDLFIGADGANSRCAP